jgi:uroporphyrinogen decarboxylase
MNYRERVLAAIAGEPIDRFPVDIWCVDEVRDRLLALCGVSEWEAVLDALEIDGIIKCKPPYKGPRPPDLGENRRQDEWGFVTQAQRYATGIYWEQIGYPLAKAQTIGDIDAYAWPDPADYDYTALRDLCASHPNRAVEVGYTAIFFWHNKLRGLEQSMMDLALRPDFSRHLIRRIADFFLEYHGRCFEAAGDLIDLTQVTDDFGSQKGLLISRDMIESYYRPWIERAIRLAKRHGLAVFHHDDGAIYSLIPDLIDMGIDVLNPIQWRCQGMDRQAIGANYAGKICFHGGVDNQETLPFGRVEDVQREVAYNLATLGRTGSGYILAPCHNIQANTPMENILGMYQSPRTLSV